MPVTINNVMVHRLVKEQHQPIRPSQMRDAVLDRTNENVQKLIHSLVSVYGTRYNTAQYGVTPLQWTGSDLSSWTRPACISS